MDLIISCGGNDFQRDMTKYPLRVYLNDGKGDFTKLNYKNTLYISSNHLSTADINNDGVKEYFIGGRSVPGHYGLIPNSYLFHLNTQSLDTIETITTFRNMGMVTCGLWKDLDNNGFEDLIVAGHWMEVKVFYNKAGILSQTPTKIGLYSSGWWNTLCIEDIDKDGDLDIIAGNLGLNSRYTSNENQPMTMFVNDYDKNGSTDIIINVFTILYYFFNLKILKINKSNNDNNCRFFASYFKIPKNRPILHLDLKRYFLSVY